jgi:hypothetical protein
MKPTSNNWVATLGRVFSAGGRERPYGACMDTTMDELAPAIIATDKVPVS